MVLVFGLALGRGRLVKPGTGLGLAFVPVPDFLPGVRVEE
jgi:hypothetical protein